MSILLHSLQTIVGWNYFQWNLESLFWIVHCLDIYGESFPFETLTTISNHTFKPSSIGAAWWISVVLYIYYISVPIGIHNFRTAPYMELFLNFFSICRRCSVIDNKYHWSIFNHIHNSLQILSWQDISHLSAAKIG